MKKLLATLALLLAPIALYYGVFLAFEPNNYFGLREETPSGAVFGAIHSYQASPIEAVVLGDSRLAHLDMDIAAAAGGRPYANLAFGGASLKEELDLLDWLLAQYDQIDLVVFGLSFYTMNQGYSADRFDTIETALYNPFAYLTSLSYNLEALQNIPVWLAGQPLGGGASETENPADYKWAAYTSPATGEVVQLRTRMIDYLGNIADYVGNWAPNNEQFDRLLDTISACQKAGIRFVVVLPPVHDCVFRFAVQANGIDAQMAPYLVRLRDSGALLLDYELENRPLLREDQYFDGMHLDYARGLDEWTEMLFAAIAADAQGIAV